MINQQKPVFTKPGQLQRAMSFLRTLGRTEGFEHSF